MPIDELPLESSDDDTTDFEPYGLESSTDLSSGSESGVPEDLELYDYDARCVD